MRSELVVDYADARMALELISAEMVKRGKAGVIAVCDAHGDLICFGRLDGAPLSSVAIAMNKAYSAARERKPSKEIGGAARKAGSEFDIGYFGDARFTGWGGGVPVWQEGRVVGAVAVSGLPEAEDIELAEMAANAITKSRE